jgi:cyclopropane fatty-acyl-phospholipid synthase-like methyltransferase
MKDEWHDPNFAVQWDQASLVGNPTRAEQLDILVSFLTDTYREGTTLLDLGMGSGLVEAQLFARRPDAYVVGIESSQAMIDLARLRLAPFQQQYRLIHHDLSDYQHMVLPPETYHIIFSVQALHHLSHHIQQDLYRTLFAILPPHGIFLLLDRIAADSEPFSDLYRSVWNRLERVSEIKSGLSGDDFLQRLQHKKEHPASLEEHLAWLRQAGFDATCLHLHLNRALLAAVKEG